MGDFCVHCCSEVAEGQGHFTPGNGFYCNACIDRECMVTCRSCGEHFRAYEMNNYKGGLYCSKDYQYAIRPSDTYPSAGRDIVPQQNRDGPVGGPSDAVASYGQAPSSPLGEYGSWERFRQMSEEPHLSDEELHGWRREDEGSVRPEEAGAGAHHAISRLSRSFLQEIHNVMTEGIIKAIHH